MPPPPPPLSPLGRRRSSSAHAACVRFARTARPWVRAIFLTCVFGLLVVVALLRTKQQGIRIGRKGWQVKTAKEANEKQPPSSSSPRRPILGRWWKRKPQRRAPVPRPRDSSIDDEDGSSLWLSFSTHDVVLERVFALWSSGRSRALAWAEERQRQHELLLDIDDHADDNPPRTSRRRRRRRRFVTIRAEMVRWAMWVLLGNVVVPAAVAILDLYVALHLLGAVLQFVGFLLAAVRAATTTSGSWFRRRPLVTFSLSDFRDTLFRPVFDFVRYHVPGVQQKMDGKAHEMMSETQESVFHKDPQRQMVTSLPWEPVPQEVLVQQLAWASLSENEKWRKGRVSGTVYTDDVQHQQSQFMASVYQLYAFSNPLHPGCWPSMNQAEAEVISMCGNLLHAPLQDPDEAVAGCVTSGGTESILLAVRAHLNYYGKRRGITQPNIVCGSTAHAALYKAADMYNIQLLVVNCNPFRRRRRYSNPTTTSDFGLDPDEVRSRINTNTVMIYASAPAYPQGIVDPVVDLAHVAQEYDIGLHVDACLGGFVLAFLEEEDEESAATPNGPTAAKGKDDNGRTPRRMPNVPVFDFRNEGVTSMSIDTHKYGYATKGTSVVLYRTRALRHAQYFTYPHWSGGMYATPTLAGSRPGALSVCAWAAMRSLGKSGYRERALRIVTASRKIAEGVATTIPGLQLLTPIDHATVVVSFGSAAPERMNIYRVSDGMTSRGWVLNELQNPPCLHVCVTLTLSGQVEPFLQDLRAAVEEALKEGADGKSKGTAGIYGAVATLPEGPIECVLNAFTDLSLAP